MFLEIQILGNHLEPLTDQQLMGICNLQQSSQQAEDALSQGMEALQQSLVETLSSTSLGPNGSGDVADYMGQMAIAMGKLATLENFLHQVTTFNLTHHASNYMNFLFWLLCMRVSEFKGRFIHARTFGSCNYNHCFFFLARLTF